MSSDNQFTSVGPAKIGFQTNSASIDIGAEITGSEAGVRGHADKGIGLEGTSNGDTEGNKDGAGVLGRGPTGVRGIGGSREKLDLKTGPGVDGYSEKGIGVLGHSDIDTGVSGDSSSGVGVKGHSNSDDGVVGLSDNNDKSGVFGFNSKADGTAFGVFGRCDSSDGAGVGAHSEKGTAVQGFSQRGLGVRGHSLGKHGVLGHSEGTGSSGVLGENTHDPGPTGLLRSAKVFGVTGRANASAGTGIFGESVSGVGVFGRGGQYGAIFEGGTAPLILHPAASSGHPVAGFHQVGELFVDSKGDLFYCKVSGSPGTWFRVSLESA